MTSLITQTLSLPDRFTITADTEEARNSLALSALKVTAITTPEQNQSARDVAVKIREFMRDAEALRTQLTRPLLSAQKGLKAIVDQHLAPLEIELIRLERLAADWLAQEKRRVDRERQEQDDRLAKLMQERLDAEARAAKAASDVQTEADLAVAIENEALARHAAAMVQQQVAEPLAKVERARGQSSRQVLRWECTDIVALYNARPDLVKLTPSASLIQELCVPECPVPGLKMWWENKATYSTR